ncbi:unnamed protein product [Dovyalis caffra]|uniref:Uncharacterized protein n=1 Tax=Dovyalis caffra TaxID=77055 RepID=A0AAV1SSC6_9ROSI|nr:unnamed protein product [Dovyalis caffra]
MENLAILAKVVRIRISKKAERFLFDHGSDTSKMEEEIPFRSWNDHIWGPKIQLNVCPCARAEYSIAERVRAASQ